MSLTLFAVKSIINHYETVLRRNRMYISVSDAAKKFGVSKRRVQTLCEQGRIKGASRISGVWLIPENVQKPVDARKKVKISKNEISEIDNIYNYKDDKLTVIQVCELLFVSQATVKNWVRLGKLKLNSDGKTFDKKYIETLLSDMKSGKDKRLKSRRNKKSINGKVLYKDYIKSDFNCKIIEDILKCTNQITEDEIRLILADFAIQLYEKSMKTSVSKELLYKGNSNVTDNSVFNSLISDMVKNVNISQIDLKNIQKALEYEIQLVPYEDTLGFVYISLQDINRRKVTGAYYTPQETVNKLIDSLKLCFDIKNRSVCDLCCGTGNFLIGLVKSGVKVSNIYGQDIDEISILIARINMFLLDTNLTKEHLYTHFVCGDTLSKTFENKFSVVLGNPPWGYNYNSDETKHLAESYVTANAKGVESYDLFIEKGLEMLEKNGYLAYVLPQAILNVKSHESARKLILQNTDFKFLNYLGNVFSNVQCPSVILGVQNGGNGKTKGCTVEFKDKKFVIKENRKIDVSQFSLNMNDDEYECLNTIASLKNVKYLKKNAEFALGIVTGNNSEFVKKSKSKNAEIVLRGSDIYRYEIKSTDNYICFTPEKFQQVAPTEIYRAKEKLLYRFIAEVPVFAYDNQQTLSLNSCNILIPKIDELNIKYILAILNSGVAAFFMNKKYNSVKLLKSHIESLPIPVVSREKQNEIIKKADRIMNSNENINGLYNELDDEIMTLYGLNAKQKNTIKTAMSGKNLFFKD